MSPCSTCRFWNEKQRREALDDDYDGVELPHRQCLAIIHGNASPSPSAEQLRTTDAFTADGSGYAATVWTLPSFGCAMHTERTP